MSSTAASPPTAPATLVGRGRRLLNRLLWLCAWSYLAVALGLWILLQWADHWWPASLFLFAPRWFCLLPIVALVPAVVLVRRKVALAPLGLAAVVMAGPVTGLCIPWRALLSATPSGPQLRVMTCNLHGGRAVNARALEAFVLESGADIVALQECPTAKTAMLGTWPGWHRHATSRLLLASQFPIKLVTELGPNSDEPTGSVTRYDLETPAGLVHFFSLHLASPRDSIYETLHDRSTSGADMRDNTARRRRQSEFIAGHADRLNGRVLLGGDFNTPPESALFHEAWADYMDAFGTAGWGWGYTFTGGRTVVRIDHILMGDGWHCTRSWVGPSVGSPHRPVFADLIWCGAPAADEVDERSAP